MHMKLEEYMATLDLLSRLERESFELADVGFYGSYHIAFERWREWALESIYEGLKEFQAREVAINMVVDRLPCDKAEAKALIERMWK